jgi:hypothetical protein
MKIRYVPNAVAQLQHMIHRMIIRIERNVYVCKILKLINLLLL